MENKKIDKAVIASLLAVTALIVMVVILIAVYH